MRSSSPDRAEPVRLEVRSEHLAATLTVTDHSWRVVANGIGWLSTDLTPGIYKIEAQLGRNNWTDYVSLRGGPQHVHVPPFGIKSAVPYSSFTRSHEYHEVQMRAAEGRTDVRVGEGARILIMARNWSPDGTASADLPRLRLERWRGDEIADFYIHGDIVSDGDAVGTCTIAVNPGTYVASAETPFGRMSLAVYALEGWETQVFVLQDFTTQRASIETSMARPTISVTQAIVRLGGAQPMLYELLEAGQAALAERRLALGRDVFDQIAYGKWDAPVLGLLAAHILLLADDRKQSTRPGAPLITFDRDYFETIVKNTAKLLGSLQPDVLALRMRSETMPAPTDVVVTTPPLFLRSWEMLLEASKAGRPNLLPGSLWRRVRGNTNSAPYFIWTRAGSAFSAQKLATERRLARDIKYVVRSMQGGEPAFAISSATQERTRSESPALVGAVSGKPDVLNLAAYAPRPDLHEILTGAESPEDATEQVARYAGLPYSVADKILNRDETREVLLRFGK